MEELVPVILGVLLGALIARRTTSHILTIINTVIVVLSGAAATVLSGEYHQSWVYLLLDCGEAALGLVVGLLAARLLTWRSPMRMARRGRGAP